MSKISIIFATLVAIVFVAFSGSAASAKSSTPDPTFDGVNQWTQDATSGKMAVVTSVFNLKDVTRAKVVAKDCRGKVIKRKAMKIAKNDDSFSVSWKNLKNLKSITVFGSIKDPKDKSSTYSTSWKYNFFNMACL